MSRQVGYERPFGNRHQSRSVVIARQGMVAASQPLAAQAGLDVLKAGGNAVDAAIAVNAMLGVVEPMSCGIGGDLFAIVWSADTEQLHGLTASGRSGSKATLESYCERGLKTIPLNSPLSFSIPGCVDGWQVLNERFGRKSLGQLLQPAIDAAEEGFPVSEIIAGSWNASREALAKWPQSAETYLNPDGSAPAVGSIFRLPRLASCYRTIVEHGRDGFYLGDVAREIARFCDENDGLLLLDDFASHTSDWTDPVSTNYRGYDVWQLPPAGQGIAVLQMLNLLEPFDLRSMGQGSADHLHLFIEAKKRAYADRATYYADPTFADVPTSQLISKEYAAENAISLEYVDNLQAPGSLLEGMGDTVYLTVVDKDRNCCSFIQSIFHSFGSNIVPGDVGFAMQNRGALFALDASHRNCLQPGKRPFHTIIPAMVTEAGQPSFCFGVMGGDMQPQGQVQVFCNLIDFGMNVQEAGDAARVRHEGSPTPTGLPPGDSRVFVEPSIGAKVIQQLKERGHNVATAGDGFGGYQGIWLDGKNGTLHGATEPRKDGAVVGY